MGRTLVGNTQPLKSSRVGRHGLRSPVALSITLAVALGIGGALSFSGTAGALLPAPGVSPIQDLNGVPNQISVEAPFIYAIPSGSSAAPAADWAFELNDDVFSPVSSVWQSGDDFVICVSGGSQDVAGGGWVDFASTPTVTVLNPTFGGTVPVFTTTLVENPTDVSNDVLLTDCMDIHFLNSGDGASLVNPILLISNVTYDVGPGTPPGTIGTLGEYINATTNTA
jgi:hypothetical protein